MKRGNDLRNRSHPGYWAFLVHRLSGLALALFLPVHFWALGLALGGTQPLDRFLRFSEQPLVKFAEWGLVVLLSLHLAGGTRLMLIEFGRWRGQRLDWIAAGAGFGAFTGLAFALALLG
jgi:fumarate reductase subunit D